MNVKTGAFLIPFLISSVVVGIPYALLEVSLGQWMKEGGIGAWNLTPLFKGSFFLFIFKIISIYRLPPYYVFFLLLLHFSSVIKREVSVIKRTKKIDIFYVFRGSACSLLYFV